MRKKINIMLIGLATITTTSTFTQKMPTNELCQIEDLENIAELNAEFNFEISGKTYYLDPIRSSVNDYYYNNENGIAVLHLGIEDDEFKLRALGCGK